MMTLRNRRRWIGWAVVAAGAAVLVGLALRAAPLEVDVAAVERGPLAVMLAEEGRTRAREPYVITAPVAGRVRRITLEPGDAVRGGETVVATFEAGDSPPLDRRARGQVEAELRSAKAAVERSRAEAQSARARLELARSDHQRFRRLAAEGVASEQQLDRATSELRDAEAGLAAAEQATRGAEGELRAAEARALGSAPAAGTGSGDVLLLRAPIDGVVLERQQESAAVLAAGTPLVTIADLDALELVADYLSADAVRIRPGMRAEVVEWGGERSLPARVRRVEPGGFREISALGVEEQRVNVVLDLIAPREEWSALGADYRVEVRVVTWEAADVVKAPVSALFRRGDGWAVFRVVGGRAELRGVEVGRRNDLEAEILSGLAPGDTLVAFPPDDLGTGTRVAPRPAE
jgi:HlyD family secretion protein